MEPFNPKSYGEFHEYLWFYTRLGVGQKKIYWLGVELSEDAQSKHDPKINPIDHWGVVLPIIHPPFMHASMDTKEVFVFDEPPI